MGKYFNDVHADAASQLAGAPCGLEDSPEIAAMRERAVTGGDYMDLAAALDSQLRYRDSAEACTRATELLPGDPRPLRQRAGRYLSTLRPALAEADFLACGDCGGDKTDVPYRLGLCRYYMGDYAEAAKRFEALMPLCGDEMGIACIYWHTLSAWRGGTEAGLLGLWHAGMDVGHHTGYEKAVRVFAGAEEPEAALESMENERDDMEYAIVLYGLCGYLEHSGKAGTASELRRRILERDGFWICYSWLAAWNDAHGGA